MDAEVTFDSEMIRNAKNKAEELWAMDAAFNIYNAAVELMNPLIPKYNELWDGIEINSIDEDGYMNEEAPYCKRYDEWHRLQYDALSYIYGVNPKTKRIVKLDYPYVLIHPETMEAKVFAHVEDFEM